MGEGNALIAMSGGVDSSVAAKMSVSEGPGCAGVMMKLHPGIPIAEEDARAVTRLMNIPLYIYDLSTRFAEEVIKQFIDAYREGRTPNPCILCNKHLKFSALLEKADELGKDSLVTGHYARIEQDTNGRYLLKKGVDENKDQSYVLYTLTQKQLARTRFPLVELTKTQVREIAHADGLKNADKSESQDICFIPDGDYAKFIEEHIGEPVQKGLFVDIDGNVLGENKGIIHYTLGQRRGLGLAMPHPPYVIEIRPGDNTVVIGKNEQLYAKTLYAKDINLVPFDRLDGPIRVYAKIRYNQRGQPATVRQTGDDTMLVEFDEPQRAITKGQAVVIYDADTVIGGGTISHN